MNRLGMTKIELLVIGLIVGLLGVMAAVAVSGARSSMRDAVRLANVREVQAGLELYFNDANSYPETSDFAALGQSATQCLGVEGFASSCSEDESVYLDLVLSPPDGGLTGLAACETYTDGYCFMGTETAYRIQFELEQDNALLELQEGLNCATEEGISAGECSSLASTLEEESSDEETDDEEESEESEE